MTFFEPILPTLVEFDGNLTLQHIYSKQLQLTSNFHGKSACIINVADINPYQHFPNFLAYAISSAKQILPNASSLLRNLLISSKLDLVSESILLQLNQLALAKTLSSCIIHEQKNCM